MLYDVVASVSQSWTTQFDRPVPTSVTDASASGSVATLLQLRWFVCFLVTVFFADKYSDISTVGVDGSVYWYEKVFISFYVH